MTAAQLANLEIVADAMEIAGLPDLGSDALLYAGSAAWDRWENHIPQVVAQLWPCMSYEARLCVYLTAKVISVGPTA